MEQYIFKISPKQEFFCTAETSTLAYMKANEFVLKNKLCHEEFAWVNSTHDFGTLYMSVGDTSN